MPTIILTIATALGINPLRLIIYAAVAVSVLVGATVVRQHFINVGWAKHKAAIERQDANAVEASRAVEKKTDACSEANGFWDVVTQGCKVQEGEAK